MTYDNRYQLDFSNYPSKGVKCYHSHPPLPLLDGKVIYGGNCNTPAVTDADVYVGLDRGSMRYSDMAFPWTAGTEFLYPIMDMSVPHDPESFKAFIKWLAKEVTLGKKVHVGCIGGHGRTGMVFAALVAYLGITKESIQYVREHYCEKAVETSSQITFLMEHFGVAKVAPTKGAVGITPAPYVEPKTTKGRKTKPIVVVGSYLIGEVPPLLSNKQEP